MSTQFEEPSPETGEPFYLPRVGEIDEVERQLTSEGREGVAMTRAGQIAEASDTALLFAAAVDIARSHQGSMPLGMLYLERANALAAIVSARHASEPTAMPIASTQEA